MPPKFFNQDTVSLAQALLGQILVHQTPAGPAGGIIVESEAYLSTDDLAAHSARGQTARNAVMFGPPGRAYIYFTYGMHWLLNVTSAPTGVGEAVLIRALEPTLGPELMEKRRRLTQPALLTNGPAKLVQALGVGSALNGHDLRRKPLVIEPGKQIGQHVIVTTTRVGIRQSADRPLRFYIKANPFVSKPWKN